MNALSYEVLKNALAGNAIALRRNRRLQPAEGPGGKIFPPTYPSDKNDKGSEKKVQYAMEKRILDDGTSAHCVLIDSVQSQANRIEQALKLNYYTPGTTHCELPIVAVDFTGNEKTQPVGYITSLDAPHRLADAILRDSELNGVPFRDTEIGKACEATTADATPLFRYCPTALVLGIWDSTGPRGGLGTKFQRALVSEMVAVNSQTGMKTASRIDPLNIAKDAANLYTYKDKSWGFDNNENAKNSVKPSEVNHGNVKPVIIDGGISCTYVQQKTVLSLPALRRLHFQGWDELAARTVLAALALCGVTLAEADMDLRSRCLLIPEAPAEWELIKADGSTEIFALTAEEAKQLLEQATQLCELKWSTDVVRLTPSKELEKLVILSREYQETQAPKTSDDK